MPSFFTQQYILMAVTFFPKSAIYRHTPQKKALNRKAQGVSTIKTDQAIQRPKSTH